MLWALLPGCIAYHVLASMKILLADDDEISRKIIASFLSRFGYESLMVQNGAEAWEVLQTPAAPPLAICDWMMPRMTGPEVCARLRAIKQPVRTYVILLSSRNSKLDIVKGLDAGADDYIVKPCDLTELQARLRVALRTLSYEAQLRKTIVEYDALIRQHKMLGEMAGNQVATSATRVPTPAAGAMNPPVDAPDAQLDLGAALCEAVREIGLGPARLEGNSALPGTADFSVVQSAYIKRDGVWLDARLDITRGGAHSLCRAVLRRSANSEHELLGVLAEVVHLLFGTRSLDSAKRALGLVPVLPPLAARSEALPRVDGNPGRRFVLTSGELIIHASLSATPVVVKQKAQAQLQPGDLVVESARVGGQGEDVEFPVGELITVHRLNALAHLPAGAQRPAVAVVEAPAGSRAYLRLTA